MNMHLLQVGMLPAWSDTGRLAGDRTTTDLFDLYT